MARGAAFNPCSERAAWLGASHDVTCCRSGGGDRRTGQRASVWAMAGSEATLGVTSDAGRDPLLHQGTLSLRLPVSFSSQLYLVPR